MYLNDHSYFYNEIQSCIQTAIRYFTGKYGLLQLYSNGHSFFYNEMQNFGTEPNGHFVFYNETQNFENCTKAASRFFYNEIQNFESSNQTAICIFHKEMRNLTIYHQSSFVSQKRKKNLSIWFLDVFFRFFILKNEIRNIIKLWITFYSQKGL